MITIEDIIQQLKEQKASIPQRKHAAVLIPIINIDNELHLLFQVRSLQLKWQPGDVCFPGGHIEPFDLTPEEAAKRETCEELGITFNDITILGSLPRLISELGFEISPFVGEIASIKKIAINTNEVQKIFTVPIKWLFNNPPIQSSIQVANKPSDDFPFHLLPNRAKNWQKKSEYPVYFYHYNEYVIWGLTAKLVNLFLSAIDNNEASNK